MSRQETFDMLRKSLPVNTSVLDRALDEIAFLQEQLAEAQKQIVRLRNVLVAYDGSHSVDQWDENIMPTRHWDKQRVEALAAKQAQEEKK